MPLSFQPLRHRCALRGTGVCGRWILLWLMLSLAAIASTAVVHPSRKMVLTCSAADAIKHDAQHHRRMPDEQDSHAHCVLCVTSGAPFSVWPLARPVLPEPLRHALRPMPAARIAAMTARPPPARGPPRAL